MLAEHDEELDDKADIALGCTKNLVTGKYARDLCETVWDMELLEWDWDKSSSTSWAWNKNNKLTYEKDGEAAHRRLLTTFLAGLRRLRSRLSVWVCSCRTLSRISSGHTVPHTPLRCVLSHETNL